MHHFCTISTKSHYYKVLTLFDSLDAYKKKDTILWVLLVDSDSPEVKANPNIQVIGQSEWTRTWGKANALKYKGQLDKLRWSLKPFFLKHLLEEKSLDCLIYVDNDIAFFGDFEFLFSELERHPVLLTPHHYPRNPNENQNWLEANFRVGLYNAGFIGVNSSAVDVIEWWGECCLYRCEKNYMRGIFDDQKYLDLFPIIEPGTKVLDHKGCNIAGWNVEICSRSFRPDSDELVIDGKWPVVFIHFNPITLKIIYDGDDPLLWTYLDQYEKMLQKHNPEVNLKMQAYRESWLGKVKLKVWRLLNHWNDRR